jgi:hypothetical protein
MRPAVIEKLAGTTLKVTFVNTGATVSPISSALLDRNEVLVNSVAATSSLNGLFYALHLLPGSAQWMVNEWRGVISANTYVERQFVRVRTMEAD